LPVFIDVAAPETFFCNSAAPAETTAALIAREVVLASTVRLPTEFFMDYLSIADAAQIDITSVASAPGERCRRAKANKMPQKKDHPMQDLCLSRFSRVCIETTLPDDRWRYTNTSNMAYKSATDSPAKSQR
jgi:hypothetical protein